MDRISIYVFVFIAFAGCIRASYLHKKADASDKYSLKVYPLLGFMLGSFRRDGILYVPALILQILSAAMLPMLALYAEGFVTIRDMNVCLGVVLLITITLIARVYIREKALIKEKP